MKIRKPRKDRDDDDLDKIIDETTGSMTEQDIKQPTEIGEAIEKLNLDRINQDGMTSMDMTSRLHPVEADGILQTDFLVRMGVIPIECMAFTRQKKRLSVSINGEGRKEVVSLVQGKNDRDNNMAGNTGFWEKWFGKRNPDAA